MLLAVTFTHIGWAVLYRLWSARKRVAILSLRRTMRYAGFAPGARNEAKRNLDPNIPCRSAAARRQLRLVVATEFGRTVYRGCEPFGPPSCRCDQKAGRDWGQLRWRW